MVVKQCEPHCKAGVYNIKNNGYMLTGNRAISIPC
nr:MAG TPA: hypothetical protein [Caudoviricetes sp.]